jgi:putative phosphoesterase
MRRVGLIADTHGLLRAEAVEALRGSDLIVHAGDVGDPAILEALGRLAPVRAVRGNNDRGAWAAALPETDRVDVGGIALYVLHDIGELAIDPGTSGCRVVVAGHSHRPAHAVREGVHFVNPGSAGPRRFRLPIAAAEVQVQGQEISARVCEFAA